MLVFEFYHHVTASNSRVLVGIRMERIYRQSCQWQNWRMVRYCAAQLRKTINRQVSGKIIICMYVFSLAPSITSLLVRGKHVIIALVSTLFVNNLFLKLLCMLIA